MPIFTDLTSQLTGPTTFTGSFFPQANSAGAAPTAPLFPNSSYQTGSWPGLGNTWGASNLLTGSLATSDSLGSGHWWGIDISWGTYLIVTASYDRFSATSNAFPFVDQDLSQGDWNPFPIPAPPPAPILPPRDLTRYKKAYSSSRHQPVRIRLVRG